VGVQWSVGNPSVEQDYSREVGIAQCDRSYSLLQLRPSQSICSLCGPFSSRTISRTQVTWSHSAPDENRQGMALDILLSMNVFISWSGERSRCFAEALRSWLKQLINVLDPWMSVADIDKGTRWRDHVAARLKTSDIGIICLTPTNLRSEWLLFEAGALSKAIDTAYVCTLLIDLEPSDISGPLAQFQATRANRNEIRDLVRTINSALGLQGRSDHELDEAFEVWWPKLEQHLSHLPAESSSPLPQRPDRELLEEILAAVRDQARRSVPSSGSNVPLIENPGPDSFEVTLRKDSEALPGVYRAKVEVHPDTYRVLIDFDPTLTKNPRNFDFAWDEEPLNSTGRRVVEKVAAYIEDVKAEHLENERSYAGEDTPEMASFRKELITELRRRRLVFAADAAEHCRISSSDDRLVMTASQLHRLSLNEKELRPVVVKVYKALFDRTPQFKVQQSRISGPGHVRETRNQSSPS
jgi:hypothetical protein